MQLVISLDNISDTLYTTRSRVGQSSTITFTHGPSISQVGGVWVREVGRVSGLILLID